MLENDSNSPPQKPEDGLNDGPVSPAPTEQNSDQDQSNPLGVGHPSPPFIPGTGFPGLRRQ